MDVFYTSSGDSDAPLPGELSKTASAPAPAAADEPCPADAAGWQQWLERAGFPPAEAALLIFERLRPRAEGTGRILEREISGRVGRA